MASNVNLDELERKANTFFNNIQMAPGNKYTLEQAIEDRKQLLASLDSTQSSLSGIASFSVADPKSNTTTTQDRRSLSSRLEQRRKEAEQSTDNILALKRNSEIVAQRL